MYSAAALYCIELSEVLQKFRDPKALQRHRHGGPSSQRKGAEEMNEGSSNGCWEMRILPLKARDAMRK
jgi:hypothetical protein